MDLLGNQDDDSSSCMLQLQDMANFKSESTDEEQLEADLVDDGFFDTLIRKQSSPNSPDEMDVGVEMDHKTNAVHLNNMIYENI